MKTAIIASLLLPLASIAFAQPQAPATPAAANSEAQAPAAATSSEQELIAMETAWSKALVDRDTAALNKILAPDWKMQDEHGRQTDRAGFFKDFADEKVSAMTNHDVHVRFVAPDLAIVQGMDNETSTTKGKSTSGTYSWTDIFQKRDGQWVAIASQDTPVTPQK